MILAQIYYQLLRTQAKFPRILSPNGQNDLEDDQWSPSSIAAERITGCMFAANLVILAQTCEESSHEQVKFPIILSQNDLEGQGQWPPFFNIPWCMFGANLVIPVQICDELSCGQSKVYGQRDGGTDAGNDNTPSGWKAKGWTLSHTFAARPILWVMEEVNKLYKGTYAPKSTRFRNTRLLRDIWFMFVISHEIRLQCLYCRVDCSCSIMQVSQIFQNAKCK